MEAKPGQFDGKPPWRRTMFFTIMTALAGLVAGLVVGFIALGVIDLMISLFVYTPVANAAEVRLVKNDEIEWEAESMDPKELQFLVNQGTAIPTARLHA